MLENTRELLRVEVRCDRFAALAVRESMRHLDPLGWILGDAMLVASELVTNAVTHSGCDPQHWIQIHLYEAPTGLWISVRDPGHSRRTPSAWSASVEAGGGLGLVIVDALSRRWGSDRDGGYHVWAELATA